MTTFITDESLYKKMQTSSGKIVSSRENLLILEECGYPLSETARKAVDQSITYSDMELPHHLKWWQGEAIKRLYVNGGLVALDLGLGKTLVGLELGKMSYEKTLLPTLFVVPKVLHPIWEREYKKWNYSYPYILINPEKLNKVSGNEEEIRYGALIVDESIMYKNRKALRTKRLASVRTQAKKVFFLSGSPFTKNLSDLWAQLNILFPKRFTSFWRFALLYCEVEIDRYGWKINKNKKGAVEQVKNHYQDIIYSLSIDESGIELPEYTHETISLSPSPSEKKSIRRILDEYKFTKSNNEVKDIVGILAQLIYLRRFYSYVKDEQETKLNTFVEMMEWLPKPVLVFSTFNETLEAIKEKFPDSGIYNANYSDNDINKFINGDIDLLLLQIKSGKFGHSFTNARSVVYFDKSFDADDYYQSLGRVKRLTSTLPVTYYHLEFENSIEKIISYVLDERITDMKKLLIMIEDTINSVQ